VTIGIKSVRLGWLIALIVSRPRPAGVSDSIKTISKRSFGIREDQIDARGHRSLLTIGFGHNLADLGFAAFFVIPE
jgi:hypothetical protein